MIKQEIFAETKTKQSSSYDRVGGWSSFIGDYSVNTFCFHFI